MLKKLKILKITTMGAIVLMSNMLAQLAYADETDDLIQRIMVERKIPGLQLAVVQNGKIIKSQNYGKSNLQHSVKVTNETTFPINSMTKLFTGVAIMQLVEQKKLTLDDEIGKYLPDLPKSWHHLTIKQLSAHTSGLPMILSGKYLDLIANNNPKAAWQLVQTKPLKFKVNSQFQYNQTGYVILGMIISKLAEQEFPNFITHNQLSQVGMPLTKQAGFAHFENVVPNQASQYSYRRDGKLRTRYGEFAPLMRAAAGMSTNANELAHYVIALQNGDLLNESNTDALWAPVVLNNGRTAGFSSLDNGYAIGWQVEKRKEHPSVSVSGGNANTLIIYPEDDLSIIILTNLMGALPIQFIDEIASTYLTDMKKENGWQIPLDLLKEEVFKHDFKNMMETTNRLENKFGIFFNHGEINDWGYELIKQNNIEAALAVFTLNTKMHPEVANTFDSLGETYAAMKQYKQALANYQKVLLLQPEHQVAKKKIKLIKLIKLMNN
jgi:CubicO group peptidase (beta-lactamase class C family)